MSCSISTKPLRRIDLTIGFCASLVTAISPLAAGAWPFLPAPGAIGLPGDLGDQTGRFWPAGCDDYVPRRGTQPNPDGKSTPNPDLFRLGSGAAPGLTDVAYRPGSTPPPTPGTSGAANGAVLIPANCHNVPGTVPVSRIDDRIAQINVICGDDDVLLRYRIHCLAYQYRALAQQIPADGRFHDLKRTISRMAADLTALADANIDPSAPPITVTQGVPGLPAIARRKVPAVRQDTLEQTIAEAERILDETATILLRSEESSRARKIIYADVARGIESSKLLLRST